MRSFGAVVVVVVVVLFALSVLCVDARERTDSVAGFKTTISQNGLDYLKDVGLTILKQKLSSVSIPDLSGTASTPIGKINWDLKNIVINQFDIPGSAITIVPGQGLTLSLSSASCSVSMNWHYKEDSFPHISDSGSADVSATLSASVTIGVTVKDMKPIFAANSCTVSVSKLDIHLHGGASWLYNVFVSVFSGDIKNAIQKALVDAIEQNINDGLNAAVASLPMTIPINSDVEISYAITAPFAFQSNFLEAPMKGEFYETAKPQECPTCKMVSTPDSITTQMVQMIVTDFVANSAGFVFFDLGQLKAVIHNKDIPTWAPISLNTSSFEYFLPQLYKKYPNRLMELVVYSTQPPTTVFSSQGASVSAVGNIDVNVILDNGTVPAFTLNGTVQTAGTAMLSGTVLSGNLTFLNGTFGLAKTEIGEFDVSILNKVLALLFSQGVVPAVNTILSAGMQLPTVQGLTFNNPSLGWGSHYLSVSTDVTYTPPAQLIPSEIFLV